MLFKRLQKHLLLCVSALLILPNSLYAEAETAEIVQSAFAMSIKNHQPINVVQQLNKNISKIYFFTDMRNFQGQTLTHQWSLNGWIAQSIPFEVKGNRWRVSSNKSLKPRSKGTWTVKVLNEQGNIIKQASISYHKVQVPAAAKKKEPKVTKTLETSEEVSTAKKAVSAKKDSPKSTNSETTAAKAKSETKASSESTSKKSNKANTDSSKKMDSESKSEKSDSKTTKAETESQKSANAKKDTASSIQAAVIESYDSGIVEDDDECTDDHDHEAEDGRVGKQQLSDE